MCGNGAAHESGRTQGDGVVDVVFVVTHGAHKGDLAAQAVAIGGGKHTQMGRGGMQIVYAHVQCGQGFKVGQLGGHGGRG